MTALIAGLYKPPPPPRGRKMYDLLRGDLMVCGVTNSPARWPVARTSKYSRSALPIMSAELARAVKTESVKAVCHHWGVRREIVYQWRRALRVPRMNLGTKRLWVELAPTKLTAEVRRAGGQARYAGRNRSAR